MSFSHSPMRPVPAPASRTGPPGGQVAGEEREADRRVAVAEGGHLGVVGVGPGVVGAGDLGGAGGGIDGVELVGVSRVTAGTGLRIDGIAGSIVISGRAGEAGDGDDGRGAGGDADRSPASGRREAVERLGGLTNRVYRVGPAGEAAGAAHPRRGDGGLYRPRGRGGERAGGGGGGGVAGGAPRRSGPRADADAARGGADDDAGALPRAGRGGAGGGGAPAGCTGAGRASPSASSSSR